MFMICLGFFIRSEPCRVTRVLLNYARLPGHPFSFEILVLYRVLALYSTVKALNGFEIVTRQPAKCLVNFSAVHAVYCY
jgi:hypothetical protein